jgi:(2Fe-2S) ferredoxin
MEKPKHHIFICSSSRVAGEPKGFCNKSAAGLIQYLESEINNRDLGNVMITNTGCLKACDRGPVLVIYPEGYWYGNVTEDSLEEILDALAENKPAEAHLIGDTTAA